MKIVSNGHQYTKTVEDKKFIFWLNVHTSIEKQSNQEWNTAAHLKNNGPHIKVLWFLGFLWWFSTYVFISICGLNECV